MRKISVLSGLLFLHVLSAQAMELPKENIWLEIHEASASNLVSQLTDGQDVHEEAACFIQDNLMLTADFSDDLVEDYFSIIKFLTLQENFVYEVSYYLDMLADSDNLKVKIMCWDLANNLLSSCYMPGQKFVRSITNEIRNNNLFCYPVLGKIYLQLVQMGFINMHIAKDFAEELSGEQVEEQAFIKALLDIVAEQLKRAPKNRRAADREGEQAKGVSRVVTSKGYTAILEQQSSDSEEKSKKSKKSEKCIIS